MTPAAAPAPPLRRILYVEDEPDIQLRALLALEKVGGFEVRACSSGEEALAALGEFRPDLVLMDVFMPGLDGPSVLARMRERSDTIGTPVVFVTGSVEPGEISGLKQLGALEAISKPFDPFELPERVRAIRSGRG